MTELLGFLQRSRRAVTAILIAYCLTCTTAKGIQRGTIEITPLGPFGETIDSAFAWLIDSEGAKTELVDGKTPLLLTVPYGRYRLRVGANSGPFRAVEREVAVNKPKSAFVIGLPIRFGDDVSGAVGDGLRIDGEVKGVHATPNAPIWLRIAGVYLVATEEQFLDANGQFSFSGLEMGLYQISTFQRNRLLNSRVVQIDTNGIPTKVIISVDETASK